MDGEIETQELIAILDKIIEETERQTDDTRGQIYQIQCLAWKALEHLGADE